MSGGIPTSGLFTARTAIPQNTPPLTTDQVKGLIDEVETQSGGKKDGLISDKELKAVIDKSSGSDKVQLQSLQSIFSDVDAAGGKKDNVIGLNDFTEFLKNKPDSSGTLTSMIAATPAAPAVPPAGQ